MLLFLLCHKIAVSHFRSYNFTLFLIITYLYPNLSSIGVRFIRGKDIFIKLTTSICILFWSAWTTIEGLGEY